VYHGNAIHDHPLLNDVKGILYGENCRPFVNIPVEFRDKYINVIFLVDTGSPTVFICQSTWEQFLPKNSNLPDNAKVKMRKEPLTVHLSPVGGIFGDINVLGASFLRHHRCGLFVDYSELTCKLNFQ